MTPATSNRVHYRDWERRSSPNHTERGKAKRAELEESKNPKETKAPVDLKKLPERRAINDEKVEYAIKRLGRGEQNRTSECTDATIGKGDLSEKLSMEELPDGISEAETSEKHKHKEMGMEGLPEKLSRAENNNERTGMEGMPDKLSNAER